VSAALTALEIDGLLDVQPGGRYRLRRRLSSGAKSTRAPS
jgi:DNA-binding FadR family transcriptional regulator